MSNTITIVINVLNYVICVIECSAAIFLIHIIFNITVITSKHICNIMLRRKVFLNI